MWTEETSITFGRCVHRQDAVCLTWDLHTVVQWGRPINKRFTRGLWRWLVSDTLVLRTHLWFKCLLILFRMGIYRYGHSTSWWSRHHIRTIIMVPRSSPSGWLQICIPPYVLQEPQNRCWVTIEYLLFPPDKLLGHPICLSRNFKSFVNVRQCWYLSFRMTKYAYDLLLVTNAD